MWLLAIGRRLRAEYAAVEQPVPERLAALVAQLGRLERSAESEPVRLAAGAAAGPSHHSPVELASVSSGLSVPPPAPDLSARPVVRAEGRAR